MHVHSRSRQLLRLAVAGAAAAVPAQAVAHQHGNTDGRLVGTETNQVAGNAVSVFHRDADGALTPAGSYPTGGTGTGANLGSQGALALHGRWLYAVDAGSNDIATFRVQRDGLRLVGRTPSGGTTPISITVGDGLLYVLNSGGSGGIAGFRIGRHGSLRPLSDSAQPLSSGAAGPAEIAFAPDGRTLVVSEKAANALVTYPVDRHGRAGAGTAHASSGATPFGFTFTPRGNLLVSEAAVAALSSYRLVGGGLTTVTGSLVNGGAAACWAIATRNGRYAFTANAASDTISSYAVARSGALSLVTPDGATATLPKGTHPTDEAITGRFLYVNGALNGTINALRIHHDGTLTSAGSVAGLPTGFSGLVVG